MDLSTIGKEKKTVSGLQIWTRGRSETKKQLDKLDYKYSDATTCWAKGKGKREEDKQPGSWEICCNANNQVNQNFLKKKR
jgi:hypothetical protein